MNGHQIDELLKRKVDNARRGRTLRTAVTVLVLLAIIALVVSAVHRHRAKAVSASDDPSTVQTETEPSPDEAEETEPPAMGANKPLQPEEMRRQQNRHELVMEWSGVPEEEIPSIVTLTMLFEGKEVARFTLSEESEWRHSWTDDYPSEALSLRADLPKSIMASFVLRDNQFTVTGASASAAPAIPADAEADGSEDGDSAAGGEGTEDSEAPEASEGEGAEDSEVPEASGGEQPEARDSAADKPAGDTPEEADDAEADESDEIQDAPKSGHNWWPIVLLMICGAVLVTLGLFGTDRRRTR